MNKLTLRKNSTQSAATISAPIPFFPSSVVIDRDECGHFAVREYDGEDCYIRTVFMSNKFDHVKAAVQAAYGWFYLPPLDDVTFPFNLYLIGDPCRELTAKIIASQIQLIRFIERADPDQTITITHSLSQKNDDIRLCDLLDAAQQAKWDFTFCRTMQYGARGIRLEAADGTVCLMAIER